jgi:hypothetical protein
MRAFHEVTVFIGLQLGTSFDDAIYGRTFNKAACLIKRLLATGVVNGRDHLNSSQLNLMKTRFHFSKKLYFLNPHSSNTGVHKYIRGKSMRPALCPQAVGGGLLLGIFLFE